MITKNMRKKLNNKVECLNLAYCNYCHHYLHTEEDCLEKHIDEYNRDLIIRKSNIPKKYWNEADPLKSFLMNNTIKGYINRKTWENTHPEHYYKIDDEIRNK